MARGEDSHPIANHECLMSSTLTNLLLVDDRAADLTVLETILAPLGQNLVLAESGQDALRHLLKTEFAAILLDVQMPQMDGFETAGMIRRSERLRQVPIIFITGVALTDENRFNGHAAGAVDYMLKPVNPEILRWKVRWTQIDSYIQRHSAAKFSHGLCPECIPKYYPGFPMPGKKL